MKPAEDFRTKYALTEACITAYESADNAVEVTVHAPVEIATVATDEDTDISIDTESTGQECKLLILEIENTHVSAAILATLATGINAEAVVVKAGEKVSMLLFHNGTEFVKAELPAKADVQAPTYAATVALEVKAKETLVSVTATGAMTLNVTDDADWDSTDGDKIHLKVAASGADRVVTPGTNCTGAAITVTSAKTNVITFIKFGANWVVSSNLQVN